MADLRGDDRAEWLLQPLRRVRDFGKAPVATVAAEDDGRTKLKARAGAAKEDQEARAMQADAERGAAMTKDVVQEELAAPVAPVVDIDFSAKEKKLRAGGTGEQSALV